MAEHSRKSGAPPSIQCICPLCEEEFICFLDRADAGALRCPGCGATLGGPDRPPSPSAPLRSCYVCGADEFYVQKDFNRAIGFLVAVTSLLIIFLVMLKWGHRFGIYCLFGLAAVDWILYRMVRDVTVCYLCQSVYRGLSADPEHRGFYLGSEEKYKHRRKEWLNSLQDRS